MSTDPKPLTAVQEADLRKRLAAADVYDMKFGATKDEAKRLLATITAERARADTADEELDKIFRAIVEHTGSDLRDFEEWRIGEMIDLLVEHNEERDGTENRLRVRAEKAEAERGRVFDLAHYRQGGGRQLQGRARPAGGGAAGDQDVCRRSRIARHASVGYPSGRNHRSRPRWRS